MAIDIDWVARLRAVPSPACPDEGELRDFVDNPEAVGAASFAHIIRGCIRCRAKLQEIVLHPSVEDLERYLKAPDDLPEETLLHCMECEICQARVEEILDGD